MCSVLGCDSERHGARRYQVTGAGPTSPFADTHFKVASFLNLTPAGTVQLKSSAAPSLCVKPEPDEPEASQMLSPDETCSSVTDVSMTASVIDEESDSMDATGESDEHRHPEEELSLVNENYGESE